MRIVFSPQASQDLIRLRAFIAAHHPQAAANAAARIVSVIDTVSQLPLIGRPVRERADIRELPFSFGASGYLLRYQLTSEDIRILRIWHMQEERSQ